MFDKDLILRSPATDLTATEGSLTGVDMGVDVAPVTYQMHVPEVAGTDTPKIVCKIQESDNNSNWRDLATFEDVTAIGEYFVTAQSNARYRRAHLTVSGTNPDFGAVMVAPVPAGRHQKF